MIMANIELKFFDSYFKDYIKVEKCGKEVIITLKEGVFFRDVTLNKSTAIKFAKTLRTEINKITESEGQNG
jgi:hypothetical protein